jgi:hypothetical protein
MSDDKATIQRVTTFIDRQLDEAERLAALHAKNLGDIEQSLDTLKRVFHAQGMTSERQTVISVLEDEHRRVALLDAEWAGRWDVLTRTKRALGGF